MKSFKEYLEARVYRVDSTRIDNFDKGKRSYAVLKGGGGSGPYDPATDKEPSWLKDQEYDLRRGLFATDYKRVLAYLIPRDVSWIRYGINDTDGKPVLYLNTRDRRKINSYRPYLSSFDSSDFEKLGTGDAAGEYFSSSPPKPIDTKRINTVLNTLRRYYDVRFVPDLVKLSKNMKAEGKHFESEGLELS